MEGGGVGTDAGNGGTAAGSSGFRRTGKRGGALKRNGYRKRKRAVERDGEDGDGERK